MKRISKRGDQTSESSLPWIIGLIVLIVLVVGIFAIKNYVGTVASLTPEQIQIAAAYCESSPFSTSDTYCNDVKPFDVSSGVRVYSACDEIADKMAITPAWSTIQCSVELRRSVATQKCRQYVDSGSVAGLKKVIISTYECNVTDGTLVGTDNTKKEVFCLTKIVDPKAVKTCTPIIATTVVNDVCENTVRYPSDADCKAKNQIV